MLREWLTAKQVKENNKTYMDKQKEEYKDYIEKGLTLEEARFIHVKLNDMEYRSESHGDKRFVFMISEPNIDVEHIQNFLSLLGFATKTEWLMTVSMMRVTVATDKELL